MATLEQRVNALESIYPTLATKEDVSHVVDILTTVTNVLEGIVKVLGKLDQRIDDAEKRMGDMDKKLDAIIWWKDQQPPGSGVNY